MRIIAIASYFSGDFKKSIEWWWLTHKTNSRTGRMLVMLKIFFSWTRIAAFSSSWIICWQKRVNHTQLATKKHGIGKKFRVSRTTGFSSSWIMCWEKKSKSCTVDNQNNTGSVHSLGFQESLDSQVPESHVDRKRVNHAWLANKITLDR